MTVLIKSSINFNGENIHMAIPYAFKGDAKLLPYKVSLLSENDCIRISGNPYRSILCVDSLCKDSRCDNDHFRDAETKIDKRQLEQKTLNK